jgi:hypothetical protein
MGIKQSSDIVQKVIASFFHDLGDASIYIEDIG